MLKIKKILFLFILCLSVQSRASVLHLADNLDQPSVSPLDKNEEPDALGDKTPPPSAIGTPENPSGLVSVERKRDPEKSYLEKRGQWSFTFGLTSETIFPDKYQSVLNPNLEYSDLFGSSTISMVGLNVGVKYNMDFGAILAEFKYSGGSVGDDRSGSLERLSLQKIGVGGTFMLDTLFKKEAYVVPYVSGEVFTYAYNEKNNATNVIDPTQTGNTKSGTTGLSTGFSAGLLFSLNWIDSEDMDLAYVGADLTNTYIDLFVSQENTSANSTDVDLQSSLNFGFGVKFEF